MKRLSFVCVFVLLSLSVFAQSIYDLDSRAGFKTLKIGTHKSVYASQMIFKGAQGGYESYLATDKQLYSVFGIKMDQVLLVFKNDILYAFSLSKKYDPNITNDNISSLALSDLDIIDDGLMSLFGKPTNSINEKTNVKNRLGLLWRGKKYSVPHSWTFFLPLM